MDCNIHICSWMQTKLNLSGDLLRAYAVIYEGLRSVQDKYILFKDTLDAMSECFNSDRKRTADLVEELERLNLIHVDRLRSGGQIYAKITIYEPENKE